MKQYLIIASIILTSLSYVSAQTGYQLSTQDQILINRFVDQVQASSAEKPAEISSKIADLMSKSRLTIKPYTALKYIQNKLQDGMQLQTINNSNLNLSFQIPKTRSIQTKDTEYGMLLIAPQHEQVAGIKTISIYQINADKSDTTLSEHINRTQSHFRTDYSGYNYTWMTQTTIQSVPAMSYLRSATHPSTQTPIQGRQTVSLSWSKGITMTYTSILSSYTDFVSVYDSIAQQIQ